jgi:hypothetical protein
MWELGSVTCCMTERDPTCCMTERDPTCCMTERDPVSQACLRVFFNDIVSLGC